MRPSSLAFIVSVLLPGQLRHHEAGPVADGVRRDVLVRVGPLGDGADVQPGLVRERRRAHVGRLRVERHVHQLGHVVRDRREPLQPVDGDGLDPHLQGEVRDDRREVAVAGALAVAVDRALHLDRAAADAGERVGDSSAGVVVEVDGDADVAAEVRDHLADHVLDLVGQACRRWCRTARGAWPPPARHPRAPAWRTRGCGGSRRRSARRRRTPRDRQRGGTPPSRPPSPRPRRGWCRAPRCTW